MWDHFVSKSLIWETTKRPCLTYSFNWTEQRSLKWNRWSIDWKDFTCKCYFLTFPFNTIFRGVHLSKCIFLYFPPSDTFSSQPQSISSIIKAVGRGPRSNSEAEPTSEGSLDCSNRRCTWYPASYSRWTIWNRSVNEFPSFTVCGYDHDFNFYLFETGKTYTLAQCIKKLLCKDNIRIMVCTHSNSAADL